MIAKLQALSEHYCDFGALLPVVRAVREQLDWPELRAETADLPFAEAFLLLCDRLEIAPLTRCTRLGAVGFPRIRNSGQRRRVKAGRWGSQRPRAAARPVRAPSLTRVLKIAREHVDAMIAHARADHPDEACGVMAGPEGSDDPVRFDAR